MWWQWRAPKKTLSHTWIICHIYNFCSAATSQIISHSCTHKSARMAPSLEKKGGWVVLYAFIWGWGVWGGVVHIHQHCGGRVLSPDLFLLVVEKANHANMINGHDYLLRKCGFLAQQLHFYDLNLGQDVLSCKQSCTQTAHRVHWGPNTSHHLFRKRGKTSCGLRRRHLS